LGNGLDASKVFLSASIGPANPRILSMAAHRDACRSQSHQAFDLALKPVGRHECFGEAREDRVV